MKYLLIYVYIFNICPATPIEGGLPHFYMESFNTYEDALNAKQKLQAEEKAYATIVYGYPQFGKLYNEDLECK